MPTWDVLLRAVAPHLAQIVSAAAPAFTARQGVVAQQIAELQQAVVGNATTIKDLAAQGQHMARALEELVAANQALTSANQAAMAQVRQTRTIALAAVAAAVVAVATAVIAAVL